MRLNRFIGEFDLSKDSVSITDRDQVSQIRNVLRLKIGDVLVIVDGQNEARAEIVDFKDGEIRLKIIERLFWEKIPHRAVNLYLSVLKKDNFELVIQKATECGVSSIIPVISDRTVKLGLNFERLQKIAKEAAEQSGRMDVPEIKDPLTLKSALGALTDRQFNIIFDPTGYPMSSLKIKEGDINLFIGPEGGWSSEEIKSFTDADKFTVLNLGENILRAETAAIVVTYLFSQVYA